MPVRFDAAVADRPRHGGFALLAALLLLLVVTIVALAATSYMVNRIDVARAPADSRAGVLTSAGALHVGVAGPRFAMFSRFDQNHRAA